MLTLELDSPADPLEEVAEMLGYDEALLKMGVRWLLFRLTFWDLLEPGTGNKNKVLINLDNKRKKKI